MVAQPQRPLLNSSPSLLLYSQVSHFIKENGEQGFSTEQNLCYVFIFKKVQWGKVLIGYAKLLISNVQENCNKAFGFLGCGLKKQNTEKVRCTDICIGNFRILYLL